MSETKPFPPEFYDEDGNFREIWMFSESTYSFYELSKKQEYIDLGEWPGDKKVVQLKHGLYESLMHPDPESYKGKVITIQVDSKGYPYLKMEVLENDPEQIKANAEMRLALLNESTIPILYLKIKNETNVEPVESLIELLNEWESYYVKVYETDPEVSTPINWPKKPKDPGAL